MPRGKKEAGTTFLDPNGNKYRRIMVDKKQYFVHQLIFLIHHGYIPKIPFMVDHINRDSLDNRIENLRECIQSQNEHNSDLPSHNSSGTKGVYYLKRSNKWRATIQVNNHRTHLGVFQIKEDAVTARRVAEAKYQT